MDLQTLNLAELFRLRTLVPVGPTWDYTQRQILERNDHGGQSIETAMRETLRNALAVPEHQSAMSVAVESYLHEVANEKCGRCMTVMSAQYSSYNGRRYCSEKCRHDAGDRDHCKRGCGCTGFAIKRRQLRNHRRTMRIMMRLIEDSGLTEELDEELMDRLGNLGASVGLDHHDHEMDEDSDAEDPMVTQANELSAVSDIVQLSRNMIELGEIRRSQKRARDGDPIA